MTLLPAGYTRRDITTGDGRVVEVLLAGPQDGPAFVLHHGTPMAAAPLPTVDAAALAAGLRLIAYSRPGYGASSDAPARVVAETAADVREILDELGVQRFVTAGLAGGGPYALACAALLPDRCAGAAALGCVAPFDAEGLDWFDGMSAARVEELEIAVRDAPRYGQILESRARRIVEAESPEQLVAILPWQLSEADRREMRGGLAAFLIASMRQAFLGGAAGWWADELALLRPWGFDLGEVRAPVVLRHGGADRVVPPAHARWIAARLPRAACRIVYDEGHWSLPATVAGEMIEALATLADCGVPRQV